MKLKNRFFIFFFLIGSFCKGQAISTVFQNLRQHHEQQNFESCVKLETEIEAIAKNQRDTATASAFFYLADAYNQSGQPNKAIIWFERERALRDELGLTASDDFSTSLYNLANL